MWKLCLILYSVLLCFAYSEKSSDNDVHSTYFHLSTKYSLEHIHGYCMLGLHLYGSSRRLFPTTFFSCIANVSYLWSMFIISIYSCHFHQTVLIRVWTLILKIFIVQGLSFKWCTYINQIEKLQTCNVLNWAPCHE